VVHFVLNLGANKFQIVNAGLNASIFLQIGEPLLT